MNGVTREGDIEAVNSDSAGGKVKHAVESMDEGGFTASYTTANTDGLPGLNGERNAIEALYGEHGLYNSYQFNVSWLKELEMSKGFHV